MHSKQQVGAWKAEGSQVCTLHWTGHSTNSSVTSVVCFLSRKGRVYSLHAESQFFGPAQLLSSSAVYMVLISLQRCAGRFNTTCLRVHASFISRHKQAYYYARQHAPRSSFSILLWSSLLTKDLGHPIRPSCLPLPSWIFCKLPWINSNLNKKYEKLRLDLTDLHTTISSHIAATCWTYLDRNCLQFACFTFLNRWHCWKHS